MYQREGRYCMARRPRIRTAVAETLDEVKNEYEYKTDDEAITHVLREAGYDV